MMMEALEVTVPMLRAVMKVEAVVVWTLRMEQQVLVEEAVVVVAVVVAVVVIMFSSMSCRSSLRPLVSNAVVL